MKIDKMLIMQIKDKVGEKCLVSKMKKTGCNVVLPVEKVKWIIIDFDKSGSPLQSSRPDFLYASDRAENGFCGIIAIVEISRGKKRASKIEEQLREGVNWIDNAIEKNLKPKLDLVYCGRIKKHERNIIRRRFEFRNQKVSPRIIGCGKPLFQDSRKGKCSPQ